MVAQRAKPDTFVCTCGCAGPGSIVGAGPERVQPAGGGSPVPGLDSGHRLAAEPDPFPQQWLLQHVRPHAPEGCGAVHARPWREPQLTPNRDGYLHVPQWNLLTVRLQVVYRVVR